jgi:hypothetical protein
MTPIAEVRRVESIDPLKIQETINKIIDGLGDHMYISSIHYVQRGTVGIIAFIHISYHQPPIIYREIDHGSR